MYELLPPEHVHALDVSRSSQCARRRRCGAGGAGRVVLEHIIAVARKRGYKRLSLETGAMQAFIPAQKLYESFGFTYGGPFGDYAADPHSTFMHLRL